MRGAVHAIARRTGAGGETEPTDDIEAVEQRVQAASRRRQRRERSASVAAPVIAVVVLLIIWEGLVRTFRVPTYLLPAPSLIVAEMIQRNDSLLRAAVPTIQEILAGFGLSIVIGIPLALAMFLWGPFARTAYPLLVSAQAVPKAAIAPLFVVWFGFGVLPKVLIAFLISFFPIVISTVVGLGSLQREKLFLAQSMGLSPLATFLKIRLPQALPSIFGGLKVAITLAVVGAIVGEFVASDNGLGYLLMTANGNQNTPLLFAGFISLTVIGVLLFVAVECAERWAIPWHRSSRGSGRMESV